MKIFLVFISLVANISLSTNIYADQAISLNWDPVTGATGYKVYCPPETTTPKTVTTNKYVFENHPDSDRFTCQVKAINQFSESELSDPLPTWLYAKGGIVYTSEISPPVSLCIAPALYAVVPNTRRADNARPLYRLQNPSLPISDTNKLVPIYPTKYVPANTPCTEPTVWVTSSGRWMTTQGGIALCLKQ